MNRAGLLVVAVALIAAVATSLSPARAQEERNGTVAIAAVVDAAVQSAPMLSRLAGGDPQLNGMLEGREVQVIEVDELLNDDQAEMLRELLSASDVLRQNGLLVHAALTDTALTELVARQDIPAYEIIAIDLSETVAEPVTVYVLRGL